MAGDAQGERRELHNLIEELPADQIQAALRYMRDFRSDAVLYSLLNAPLDDEPYTEAQRQRDAQSETELPAGGVSHEDVLREFGLLSPDRV